MSSRKINVKTIARIAAIQLLYQFNNYEKNVDLLTQQMVEHYNDMELEDNTIKIKLNINYFKLLVDLTISNIDLIKKNIENFLVKDNTEIVPGLSMAIIMTGSTELTFLPEVPFKVVINEYSSIAASMVSDAEVALVNSILDKIAKRAL